jgi:transposase
MATRSPRNTDLKDLLARFDGIEKDLQREKNRQEKAQISLAPEEVIHSLTLMIAQLETEQQRLEKLIEDHLNKHDKLRENKALLESIPAVGNVIATRMLMVIGSRQFDDAHQCAAYLGLIPIQHESGSSIKGRARLSCPKRATP